MDSAQEKLKDLDAKIDELSKQAANAKPDIRQQVQSSLDKLKEQRTTVQQKFNDLKAGGKEGWEKTKDAFSTAWQDLEKTYQDTKAKLQQ